MLIVPAALFVVTPLKIPDPPEIVINPSLVR